VAGGPGLGVVDDEHATANNAATATIKRLTLQMVPKVRAESTAVQRHLRGFSLAQRGL
jgi:hypothetical protein